MWYNNGCRTLDDVSVRKGGIKLSHVQEIGLQFYDGWPLVFTRIGTWMILLPDINDRMPRSEAEAIFNLIKPIGKVLRYGFSRPIDLDVTQTALKLDEHLFIDIMGSFRRFAVIYSCLPYPHFFDRGKATCGDIDILVTRPTSDGMTHAGECFCFLVIWCRFIRIIHIGLLPELLARLHAAKILTEDLALPDDFSALELCYRGLCKLPEPDAKRRRIDILCVPWESRGAALLYYTVSNSSVCTQFCDVFIRLQGDDIVSNLNYRCVINDADMSHSSIGPWEWRRMF